MSLILKNACFINHEDLSFSNSHLKIEEGKDKSIIFYDSIEEITIGSDDRVIDCEGKIVTKSFAVGHHHAYSALATGAPAPKKSPGSFHEVLKYIWWNIDKALDKDMLEASALATALACAKSGSTFIIDHHSSPNHIPGSLDLIANAFEKVGINHLLCYEISDRDGQERAQQGLEETETYLKDSQGLVGLHASFTVGDDTLKNAVDLMNRNNSGIHIHIAEDKYDQEQCLLHHNKRVVERMNDFGVLDSSKTILGHCLHITDTERSLIKSSKAFVVQNTESNLNNNVGSFNSTGLGANIMIGTDGMHSDMIRSSQAAYFVGQTNDDIDFMGAYKRSRESHKYLNINGFSGDGDNNLIVLDYNSPTEITQSNFLGHFVFGLSSNHIQHVISDGKLIVEDRVVKNVNEEEVLQFTKEQSIRLWNKL